MKVFAKVPAYRNLPGRLLLLALLASCQPKGAATVPAVTAGASDVQPVVTATASLASPMPIASVADSSATSSLATPGSTGAAGAVTGQKPANHSGSGTTELQCGKTLLQIAFGAEIAIVKINVEHTVTLSQKRSGSGYWYEGDGYVLRGKSPLATWTVPEGKTLHCREHPIK